MSKRIERMLREEQYKYCENPKCGERFRVGTSDQKYCRAVCYKQHRRDKYLARKKREESEVE